MKLGIIQISPLKYLFLTQQIYFFSPFKNYVTIITIQIDIGHILVGGN